MDSTGIQWTRESLKEAIRPFHNDTYAWSKLSGTVFEEMRKAGILVPLVLIEGKIHVLLTRRAFHLKNDGGHVAFPGGHRDVTDINESQTCLREAEEEVNLQENQVEIVSQLLPRINKRLILITPVVCLLDSNYTAKANPDEVDSLFVLPLSRFLSEKEHTFTTYQAREVLWTVHFFTDRVNGEKYVTWGLTAAILVELAITIYKKAPEFEWDIEGMNTIEDPYRLQLHYLQTFERQRSNETHSKL